VQFRYAFVCDEEGVKVIDVTNPAAARPVEGEKAVVPIKEAHNLYLVRTYAYVAAGKDGLVIIDIERPEEPKFVEAYNSKGKIVDARDVKVGMTNVSLFAYVADGEGRALHVIQLTSPEKTPGNYGFSPKPKPELIATKALLGPALAISEGTDRDRAVDENGHQLAVFGRRGARPLNGAEMQRMYMKDGKLYTVPDIRDTNTKENADIRRRYGKPGQPDAASEQQLKQEQKKGDEPKKSASLKGPFGFGLTGELMGLAILFLPFVITFHRWRRGSKRR
jgi:hypothetical protein